MGGGGGGVLSRTTGREKKSDFGQKGGGFQPPPPHTSYLMIKHIFRSAGVDMASVYLNLQKQIIYSCIHVTLQCCCSV